MTSGIYKILNTNNNKVYIGSSKEIEKRWKRHKTELKNNKHHSLKLQRAWNKENDPSVFEFSIVEECSVDQLMGREQEWIDNTQSYYKGYNCCKYATGGGTDPIKADVLEKSEKRLNEMFENFRAFNDKRETSIAQDKLVSYLNTKINSQATATTGYICRLWKLSKILVYIEDQLSTLPESESYKISSFSYRETGSVYVYPYVCKNKHSQHNKYKKTNILDTLWEEVLESLGNRVGKSILDKYQNYLDKNSPLN